MISYDTVLVLGLLPSIAGLSVLVVATCVVVLLRLYQHPPFPSKTPELVADNYPILGAFKFFTARWDWFQKARTESSTGNFSFYVGYYPIIALTGAASRQIYFDSKQLGFNEGYSVLFGGSPEVKPDTGVGADGLPTSEFGRYFNKRITHMLKRENFSRGLPNLLGDTKARLDELAASPSGMTDPFKSVYEIVFQLTMRTVGCNEIADDLALLRRTLSIYETIEGSSTPTSIIFPWLPSISLFKRTLAGGRLYMILKKIVDERKKTGKTENDPLQHLIENDDSMPDIVAFVVGALFAGLLNSGINAANVIAQLGIHPDWLTKVREEVKTVASKYASDKTAPLTDQLLCVPSDAWQTEFPAIDLCLRESIRMQMVGSFLRKNISGREVKVGDEIIPTDAFATYHVHDTHYNPSIYPDPEVFDPSRYLPDRAEDKKEHYGYVGWGAGRHPCLGMRFAKLEMNIIVAFFLARFDFEVCDKRGNQLSSIPLPDLNNHHAAKPKVPIYLKYNVKG